MIDKTFFKFALGFLCILALSFFVSASFGGNRSGEEGKASVIEAR